MQGLVETFLPDLCFYEKYLLYLHHQINIKVMAKQGVLTTADYMSYNEFKRLISNLRNDRNYKFEAYCFISFATGLRISDVLTLKWSDILGSDTLVKTEKKTSKTRRISFSQATVERIKELYVLLKKPSKSSVVFDMSEQYINRTLKAFKSKYSLDIENFSSHSLRKTFARHIWESNNRSEESLILLSQILKHSNIGTTRRYLGITGDEIDNIYKSISI